VLGEPQILGQLKSAFQDARHAGTLGSQLGRLFQHAFSVAKQVRTDTAIGESAVSVAFAAVNLAKQIFGDLDKQTALMIGAGETIELAARHLHANGIGKIMVANRSLERAENLAEQFSGEALTLPALADRMHEADIIISSTASPLPILGKGATERALKLRRHRPFFMVDIAVPRDIEPEVGELDDDFLYTVDDLQEVIEENLQSRREAAEQAEEIILGRAEEFKGWLRGQGAVDMITSYRNQAQATQQEVLDKARRMLEQGKSADEALQFLAHTLTNKLTHAPTTQLNSAAREGRLEFVEMARELLGLNNDS
jgi:glutamyl-tRNA reductase